MPKENITNFPSTLQDTIQKSIRPVAKEDTWCYFRQRGYLDPEIPYGVIVTMPYGICIDFFWLGGYVVRTKRHDKDFLLQLVCIQKKKRKSYSVVCEDREVSKKVKGKLRVVIRRFVHVRSKRYY
jgi:hypothetical protein